MKKTKVIAIIIILLGIIGLIWVFSKGEPEQQVSKLDAVDTAGEFYQNWLNALKAPNAEPNIKTLSESPILSKSLREKIKNAQKDSETALDPVLCQTEVPEDISMRRVFITEDEAQMLVTSKNKEVTDQATVILRGYNDGWYIDDIQCSLGEFAPEREFSFEKEGFLLKDSIPEPYNPKNWHLVFEENGQSGHVVPLFFDSETQCTDLSGKESICKPEEFTEATKVFVRSQMTERGADVKQLQVVK